MADILNIMQQRVKVAEERAVVADERGKKADEGARVVEERGKAADMRVRVAKEKQEKLVRGKSYEKNKVLESGNIIVYYLQ